MVAGLGGDEALPTRREWLGGSRAQSASSAFVDGIDLGMAAMSAPDSLVTMPLRPAEREAGSFPITKADRRNRSPQTSAIGQADEKKRVRVDGDIIGANENDK